MKWLTLSVILVLIGLNAYRVTAADEVKLEERTEKNDVNLNENKNENNNINNLKSEVTITDVNLNAQTEKRDRQLDERISAIFAELESTLFNTTEKETLVKLSSSNKQEADYLLSGVRGMWNGGNAKSHELEKVATLAQTAYKKLLSEEETTNLQYKNAYMPNKYCSARNYIRCDEISYKWYSLDGSCNNLQHPWWGKAETVFKRILPPAYDDSISVPRIRSHVPGKFLPNARRVALVVHKPYKTISDWTNILLFFGQSVAHDLTMMSSSSGYSGEPKSCYCNSKDPDCFNIPIPYGDYHNQDQTCMTFVRSSASVNEYECKLGPREQLNMQTGLLDLSHIYGTSRRVSDKIRLFKRGLLKHSYLPNSSKQQLPRRPGSNCPTYNRLEKCFITADPRAEDSAYLTSMHTIWIREHNRVAEAIYRFYPMYSDEQIFLIARRVVISEMQHMVYAEYLPAMLGPKLMNDFGLWPAKQGYFMGYDVKVNPSVANEFAVAAMRSCHALVPQELQKADSLGHLFHKRNTGYYLHNTSLSFYYPDAPLKGSLIEWSYYLTPQVNYDLNNYLFQGVFKESKRFSLPALNIQRSRDHGIPGYNYFRQWCGLSWANRFEDFDNIAPHIIARLREVYDHPNDVELWTGMVSEYPVQGGVLGPTAACIAAFGFKDWKYGDRLFYENGQDPATWLSPAQLQSVRNANIARLLCDNIDINFIQRWPLFVADKFKNPIVDCSKLPRVDLSVFSY